MSNQNNTLEPIAYSTNAPNCIEVQHSPKLLYSNYPDLNGVELCRADSRDCLLLCSDASEPGRFRAQRFSEDGLKNHVAFDSQLETLQYAALNGYTVPRPGALNQAFSSDQFNKSYD